MKIEKIKIYGFGKWVNQTFTLSDDLSIFYGVNEAGKSTLMAFITGMLFGFASKKSKFINTYEPKDEAIYGGELEFEYQDKKYRLIRKYRTNTEVQIIELPTHTAIANPQMFLETVLGPITAETFQQIYAINAEELAEIRSLTPNEIEQRLLKIGAVGAVEWLKVAEKFEKEAQNIFAANSKNGKRPLNTLLVQYRNTIDNQITIQRQLPTYFASLESLKILKDNIAKLNNKTEMVQNKIIELRELSRLEPIYQEIKRLLKGKKQQVQKINDDTNQRFEQLQFQKANLIEEITQLEQQNGKQYQDLGENNDFDVTLENLQLQMSSNFELITRYQVLQQDVAKSQDRLEALKNELGFSEVPSIASLEHTRTLAGSSNNLKKLLVGGLVAAGIIAILSINLMVKILFILGIVAILIRPIKKQLQVTTQNNNKNTRKELLISSYWQEYEQTTTYQKQLLQSQEQIKAQQNKINQYQLPGVKVTKSPEEFKLQLQQINALIAKNNNQQASFALGKADQVYQEQYYKQRKQQLTQLESEIKTLLTSVGLRDEAEFHLQMVKQNVENEQRQRLATLKQQLTPEQFSYFTKLTKSVATTIDDEEHKLATNKVELTALNNQYHDAQLQHLKVVNNGTISEIEQQVANLQHDVLSELNEYFVNQLTAQWINEALKQSSQQRMPQIINLATKYLQMLTGGHFKAIKFKNNGIQLLSTENVIFTLAELSKGTSEQLYVAFRLAFAEVLGDVIKFPIIIDDGFVNFDAVRLQRMHTIISEISNQQVIYFTSNTTIHKDFANIKIIEL